MTSWMRWVVAGAVALAVTAAAGVLHLDRHLGLGDPPVLRILARSQVPFTRPLADDVRVQWWRRLLPGRDVRMQDTGADTVILVNGYADDWPAVFWALTQQGDLGVWRPARGTDVARQWNQRIEAGALAERRLRTATSTWRDPSTGETVVDHHLLGEPWGLMEAAVELDRELPVPAGFAVAVEGGGKNPPRTVFVHEPPVFFNDDIVETRLLPGGGSADRLEVRLTTAAAERLAETTAAHPDDELTVQLLGEIRLRVPIDRAATGDRWTVGLDSTGMNPAEARMVLRAVRPGEPLPRTLLKLVGSHPASRPWRWPLAALLGVLAGLFAFAVAGRLTRPARSTADRAAAPFA